MGRAKGSKDKQPRKRRGTALVAIKLSELTKTFNPDALILVGHEFAKSLMLKNYTAVEDIKDSPELQNDTPIQFTVVDPRQENGDLNFLEDIKPETVTTEFEQQREVNT